MIYFKLPNKNTLYTLIENEETNSTLEFVSFDSKTKVTFNGSIKTTTASHILSDSFYSSQIEHSYPLDELEDKESYFAKIKEVIKTIEENQLSKLVFSRKKRVDYKSIANEGIVNLSQTFINLCNSYSNAFVYLFYHNDMCWMGAFSEILGKYNTSNHQFETMSLAGTLPKEEAWTTKEIEEQMPVTKYIQNVLEKYNTSVKISDTSDHISGNIKHLRTDFSTTIKESDLEHLISDLHPTPAVCGFPKELCMSKIQTLENHDRELYSGYIKIQTREEIFYFVNLRCAQFFKNELHVYVGGGITQKSHPEKEWQETELKSQAILKNISTI